jgi:hypothetical protein
VRLVLHTGVMMKVVCEWRGDVVLRLTGAALGHRKEEMSGEDRKRINQLYWRRTLYDAVVAHVRNGRALVRVWSWQRVTIGRLRPRLTVRAGELHYRGLPVVRREEIRSTLQGMYDDPPTSRNGRDSFASHVVDRVYGISRAEVLRFLMDQEAYQIHLPLPPPTIAQPSSSESNAGEQHQ